MPVDSSSTFKNERVRLRNVMHDNERPKTSGPSIRDKLASYAILECRCNENYPCGSCVFILNELYRFFMAESKRLGWNVPRIEQPIIEKAAPQVETTRVKKKYHRRRKLAHKTEQQLEFEKLGGMTGYLKFLHKRLGIPSFLMKKKGELQQIADGKHITLLTIPVWKDLRRQEEAAKLKASDAASNTQAQ